jgi:PAS domain S-box-containing protein
MLRAMSAHYRVPGDDEASERVALLAAVLDKLPVIVGYWDATQRCRLANRAYVKWFGVTPEEMIGMELRDLLGPQYPLALPHIEGALRGEPQRFEREIPDPAGGPARCSQAHYLPHVVDGAVLGFFVLLADVTEHRRAEEAARQAERELGMIIDNAPIGEAIIDPNGRWLRANRVVCEMLGYSASELQQMTFQDVTHADDLETDVEHVATLLRGERTRYSMAKRYIARDRRIVDVMLHVSLVRDDAGAPKYFISQIEDRTEQKAVEQRMMLADRMASVGTLAAGVAHEINNPLAYLVANLDTVVERIAELRGGPASTTLQEVLELVTEAREGAERVRKVIRGMQTFSHARSELVPVSVREALDLAVDMTINEIRHRALVAREYANVRAVEAESAKLVQVFINVILNAAQALPEGHASDNQLTLRLFEGAAGRVVVEISDTGHGIPSAIVGRVFEPFFTTRKVGAGAGLGLSISHAIVSSFAGEIGVESHEGSGTTVRISLPATDAPVRPRSHPPSARPATSAERARIRGRILVVDDEPAIARAIARALGSEHDITTAGNGKEALTLALGSSFDVILSDLMMPEMTGMELHARLVEESPRQAERMVFMTGGAFTASARDFLRSVRNPRLEKPLEMSNLNAILRGIVAEARRT